MSVCARPHDSANWLRCASFAALVLGAAAGAGACQNSRAGAAKSAATPAEYQVPERARTAGDELLAMAPAGANVVVEVDLGRLRANPVAGPLIRQVSGLLAKPLAGQLTGQQAGQSAGPSGTSDEPSVASGDWLQETDAVLLCAYNVGEGGASTITLIRGAAPLGVSLAERTAILAGAEWVARARAVVAGDAPSLAEDRALMRIRTRAMPARAEGGFLRVAARLSFGARVELASRFELDAVPAAVSVWADVADDFAAVAELAGTEVEDGEALTRGAESAIIKLSQIPWIRARYLHFIVRTVDISAGELSARLTLIIGPLRLQRLVARAMRSLLPESQDHPSRQSP